MSIVLAGALYCNLGADRAQSSLELLHNAWLEVDDGKIIAIGTGGIPQGEIIADFSEYTLAPTLFDMHTHGGGGHAFDELNTADAGGCEHLAQPEIAAKISAVHSAAGVSKLVISLVTGEFSAMLRRVRAAARLCATRREFVGIHLEGPFLAAGKRGAHDPLLLKNPDAEQIAELIAAANGYLLQVTLAPELPGAFEAIRQLTAAGVKVAVGHTECDYDTAKAAFNAGASILTHAFNGMCGLEHRSPGPVAAAFDCDWVTLEVIADGQHVDRRMVRLLFEQAPGRVALISDAMAAAGMPDGDYLLGALPVSVQQGLPRLRTADGELGSIAGSTLRLLPAINNVISWGVPVSEALAAASTVPAKALGVENVTGMLAPGKLAAFTVFQGVIGQANAASGEQNALLLEKLWHSPKNRA